MLLTWLFCLPAATPLLQPTIPHSADGLLHLYRLVALSQAVEQGALFPRWLPDLAYGYGFPLFVFYAPLAYYLTLTLNFIVSLPVAFNLSFGLALWMSATGVYLFIKDRFGPRAALLASVAYVYAPFQLFNAFSRGGLPAAWAMALYPLTFWAFGRLHRSPSPVYVPICALSLGLALLTHNTLTLLFIPLLGAYLLVDLTTCFFRQQHPVKAPLVRMGLALLLGGGLAAFFLVPAIIEKEFAQVQRVITSPDFDFRFHFVTLRDLFSLPSAANTGLLNPKLPLTLGLAQIAIAVLGFILLMVQMLNSHPATQQDNFRFTQLPLIVFGWLSLIGFTFMMLPASLPVWERLPLIEFVQFPHRLLGPAALSLAILVGAAGAAWPNRRGFWFTIVGIVAIFITTAPLLYPRYNTNLPVKPTLADMMAYERASGVIGTTSFGEYLPIWVSNIPRESPLEPMYQTGGPVERLDPAYLPPGAKVEAAEYGFNQARLVIDTPVPFQAVFHTFYFPGWQAEVNGQSTRITPFSERGLLRVDMPAGRHELRLYFQDTALRQAANGVSWVSGVVILILLINSIPRVVRSAYCVKDTPTHYALRTMFPRNVVVLTSLAIALLSLKILYLDQFDNPLKHIFDGNTVAGAEVKTQVNFGDQVNLLGYDLDRTTVAAGDSFRLTAYWQARRPLATAYSALAHLVDAEKHLYAGQDNLHPGGLPATQWSPWGFVQDAHLIRVPPGTPPGEYFLTTGLYDPATWQRLPVLNGSRSNWIDVVAVPVTVQKRPQPPTIETLGIRRPQIVEFGPDLRLLGATPERDLIRRSDFLRIALFWEAKRRPATNYRISLRLLDEQQNVLLHHTNQPSHGRYPTTLWSSGERVRDNHALWIPADFPAGSYHIEVQVLDAAGQSLAEWVGLGQVELEIRN